MLAKITWLDSNIINLLKFVEMINEHHEGCLRTEETTTVDN